MAKLLDLRVYRGPNVYSLTRMIRMRVDIEALEEHPTDQMPGFVDRLLADMPTLYDHHCCFGHPGGFVERLRSGTWFGHVLEHVALELQGLAGSEGTRGKTRGAGPKGVYNVLFTYDDEEVGIEAGKVALLYLCGLLPAGLSSPISENMVPECAPEALAGKVPFVVLKKSFLEYAAERAIGPSTRSLVEEARRRNIPVQRLGDNNLFQLGWGSSQQRIQATVTDRTPYLAVELAQDKVRTVKILSAAGLPVPQQRTVATVEAAVKAAKYIGYPVVVKPADLSKGRGVFLNLQTPEAVRDAWNAASALSDDLLVETYFPGRDFRVLVVGEKVVAVAERVPAHVVGDGVQTILELVETVNSDPRRGEGHEKVLTRIALDASSLGVLAAYGLTPESVPDAGQICFLRHTANLSTGGTAIDRTDEIHPDNALLAVRAARQIGLDVAGVDVVCPDIGKPVQKTGGGIVEVNAAPGFRMHLAPAVGKPRNVAEPVLDHLFGDGDGRIPIVAITGTNGKTTTTKMVAHILGASGKRVGHTCSKGIYVGKKRVEAGDCSGPRSARVLLEDRGIDVAVLETARGGIAREGLAFDQCDVGCVLNVTSDHLGIQGIHTLEELAKVKGVVVETVKRRGASVLNADDPLCRGLAEEAGGRVVWFSRANGAFVKERIAKGDWAAVFEDGDIVLHDNEGPVRIATAGYLPVTINGTAMFNVENALAAVAIARSLNVPLGDLRRALASFTTSIEENPGRCNVFHDLPFMVVVDYAHNEAALRAISQFVIHQSYRRAIAVLMSAGDRRDEDVRLLGKIAAEHFDVLIAKEDESRRGRLEGELAALMIKGATEAGMPRQAIHQAMSDDEAVDLALSLAEPGDIVLLCLEDTDGIVARIEQETAALAMRRAAERESPGSLEAANQVQRGRGREPNTEEEALRAARVG